MYPKRYLEKNLWVPRYVSDFVLFPNKQKYYENSVKEVISSLTELYNKENRLLQLKTKKPKNISSTDNSNKKSSLKANKFRIKKVRFCEDENTYHTYDPNTSICVPKSILKVTDIKLNKISANEYDYQIVDFSKSKLNKEISVNESKSKKT